MDAVRATCTRLDALRSMVGDILGSKSGEGKSGDAAAVEKLAAEMISRFEEGMNDDLHTGKAIDGVFETVESLHGLSREGKIDRTRAAHIEEGLRRIDAVLQVIFD